MFLPLFAFGALATPHATDPAPAAAAAPAVAAVAEDDESGRPPYAFLRQHEDWSDFDRDRVPAGAGHWADGLKNIETSPYVHLTFGGSARARFESWNGFGFGPPPPADDSDTFLLTRVRAHAEARIDGDQRLFLELKTAQATDRSLPGGRRALDMDTFAIQQLFYDVNFGLGDEAFTLRLGRQMLSFGAQRLVSPLPWGNTLRTWDAALLEWKHDDLKVTGFYSQFVPVDKTERNEHDPQNALWGAYATLAQTSDRLGIDGYVLGSERDPRTVNGTAGKDQRLTVGLRLFGDLGDGFDLDVETAMQSGELGDQDIDASMIGAQLGWRPDADGPTRLFAGIDVASGDSSPGGDVETFDALFPLGHAYLGQADVVGRSNIIAASLGVDHKIGAKWSVHSSVFAFRLADTDDALYNPGNGVVIGGGTADSSTVGYELDLRARYTFDSRTNVEAGYSHFFVGDALKDAGRDDDADFFYLQASTRF